MGRFDGVYRLHTFDEKYGEMLRAMGNVELFYKVSPQTLTFSSNFGLWAYISRWEAVFFVVVNLQKREI